MYLSLFFNYQLFQEKDIHNVVALIVEIIATIIPNNSGYIYRVFPIYLVYLYMFSVLRSKYVPYVKLRSYSMMATKKKRTI